MDSNELLCDAACFAQLPLDTSNSSSYPLDSVLRALTLDDLKSIFFLLMDKIGPNDFMHFLRKSRSYLICKFIENNFKLYLIEILGTMKKFALLKRLGICRHVFQKDKNTFNDIEFLWKYLYAICEQLTDGDVEYMRQKYFADHSGFICAEELFCFAYMKKKFHPDDLSPLLDMFKEFRPDCCKIVEAFQDDPKLKYYRIKRPTKTSPCGLAIIFANTDFPSTPLRPIPENDAESKNLQELWETFGFKTEIVSNYTDEMAWKKISEIEKIDHSNYDAFVICYLSHGNKGVVYASNGKEIVINSLVDSIANKCDSLLNKPKLFFIQACQGLQVPQGFGNPVVSLPSAKETELPTSTSLGNHGPRCDVLLCVSSIEGFVSFRPSGENSWFMDSLIKELKASGEKLTVTSIMTNVCCRVSNLTGNMAEIINCKQTSNFNSTLRYELKLKKMLHGVEKKIPSP